VIDVARQLGHGADLTLRCYGHVIDELEGAPRVAAEDAIRMGPKWQASTSEVRFERLSASCDPAIPDEH
jgi:hypothetical protein